MEVSGAFFYQVLTVLLARFPNLASENGSTGVISQQRRDCDLLQTLPLRLCKHFQHTLTHLRR